ncbi:PREDICTED: diuretic hormone class 2 [Ceratosolen solmsi marchali]|uniref:Diuretic hormone class 2 n=1 Tax=Ceratosolen solmsi marchali TaxID=326594 RepID=A0AAJ7DW70_9HYME|nr:PREDICTED: diuretic hormone class 2 [Ceratosolen solmsi marchali]
MQKKIALSWLLLATLAALTIPNRVEALPYTRSRTLWNQFQEDYPEAAQELLDRIENLAIFVQPDNAKRGLDLGLSRGFSGSQAAKHLMGLAAANYAGGPGRRRRSEQA